MESKNWGLSCCDFYARTMVSPINSQPRWNETTAWSTQPLPPPSPPASSMAWSSSSSPPDSMEDILARIARLEARLEAKEQRWAPASPPPRAEAAPPFGLPDWCLPMWDPGSHQATIPAAPISATSLPAVQHKPQPLPAPYEAARPPLGFRQLRPAQLAPWESPVADDDDYDVNYSAAMEYSGLPVGHNIPQVGPIDIRRIPTASVAAYAQSPPPSREGCYVQPPRPIPLSHPQPQQPDGGYVLAPPSYVPPPHPRDSPCSLTTLNVVQFTTSIERERERGVREMVEEEKKDTEVTENPITAAETLSKTTVRRVEKDKRSQLSTDSEISASRDSFPASSKAFAIANPGRCFSTGVKVSAAAQNKLDRALDIKFKVGKLMPKKPLLLGDFHFKILYNTYPHHVVLLRWMEGENVFLEVWRRLVIFGLYELAEVYKDLLYLHLEDKVILEGGGVDT